MQIPDAAKNNSVPHWQQKLEGHTVAFGSYHLNYTSNQSFWCYNVVIQATVMMWYSFKYPASHHISCTKGPLTKSACRPCVVRPICSQCNYWEWVFTHACIPSLCDADQTEAQMMDDVWKPSDDFEWGLCTISVYFGNLCSTRTQSSQQPDNGCTFDVMTIVWSWTDEARMS